ncbi:energy transducer TonB [Mucilaginibacter sp. X5P1]|uniref:energy transducer TonB n=1 Tax=Mucilaginibacter sp. X5P1 TaxID=2723088 RepID=UPI001615BD85|nr:energy transducer TonB [Mucilaginibacter sp. X5P1]MBB6141166.1 TonB family protein [Mucilaginibacter sp. X5P1]
MKKLIFNTFLLILWVSDIFAQQKPQRIISKDTINLRGTIYNAAGKPAGDILIESRQLDLQYNKYPIRAITDSTGHFEMKGVKPQDTLTIEDFNYFPKLKYMNEGSRYMAIYLPVENVYKINSDIPIIIEAKRQYLRAASVFKIEDDGQLGCGTNSEAAIPGGRQRLFNYIQSKLSYPEKAITQNIEGTVEVSFTVDKDGTLHNFNIIKGIGYGCDEEVLTILKGSPKWRPGILEGRPVTMHESISVEFKLTDK